MMNLMTLLESIRMPWRRGGPFSEPPAPVLPIDAATSRVPAEYRSLSTYLERRYASVVVLTFEQVEALLGFALPARACTERGWWTSGDTSTNRYAEAWIGAGRSATPNFPARTVTFERRS
jgi:hypothetical protein